MTSTGISAVVEVIKTARGNRQALVDAHAKAIQQIDRGIADLEHQKELMQVSSLSVEEIAMARSLVRIRGSLLEDAQGAFQAAIDDLSEGGVRLCQRYIGAKRYDGFHQREDHNYGYGPAHGSTVFAIELTREARSREARPPLSREERDVVVRWLLIEMEVAKASNRRR